MLTQDGRLAVRLLGPFEVCVGARPIQLTTGRLRTLIVTLALSAGRTVTVDQLATAVWGHDLPLDVRRTVSTYMTRLRTALGAASIAFSSAGYLLRVAPDDVDGVRFGRLLGAAARATDPTRETGLLDEALALWRGVPFEGVRSSWLEESEAPRILERYLSAVERRADLLVAAGRGTELVPQLRELTARFPLRESLLARLLVVLERGGRTVEALEHYESIRMRTVRELGVDPGPELQEIYGRLLARTGPSTADSPLTTVVPRQLPPDVDGFAGRTAELARMEGLLDGEPAVPPARIMVIAGTAGVGKSALAVHWAHRVAHRFPDGQLYVNLRGSGRSTAPVPPAEAIDGLLDALAVPAQQHPTGVDARCALYRSLLSGKRVLVLLDDAHDADQVRPLLPGGPGCVAVVTSRSPLTSILVALGARALTLDRPTVDEARQLLAHRLGADRVLAEPDGVAQLIDSCARLPLALALVAARAAARPAHPLAALAAQLHNGTSGWYV